MQLHLIKAGIKLESINLNQPADYKQADYLNPPAMQTTITINLPATDAQAPADG